MVPWCVSTADFLQSSSVFWDKLIVEPVGHYCQSHLRWRLGASWEPFLLDLQKCHMTMMCHPISWLIQVCHPICTGRMLPPDCSTGMWKHGTKKTPRQWGHTSTCTRFISDPCKKGKPLHGWGRRQDYLVWEQQIPSLDTGGYWDSQDCKLEFSPQ